MLLPNIQNEFRKTVKTIFTRTGPTITYTTKNDGGLFLYPPSPTSKDGVGCLAPILLVGKTEKKIQTSLDCFTRNANFVQTEYY